MSRKCVADRKKLSEGKPALIAVRDIPPDEKSPFTTEQTVEMLSKQTHIKNLGEIK